MANNEVRDVLQSCLEKYDAASHLLQEDNKRDPENEPYRSQYAAKDLLEQIKRDLAKLADRLGASLEAEHAQDLTEDIAAATALVDYHLGVIGMDTEELSTGEEHLAKCQFGNLEEGGITAGSPASRKRILIAVRSLNQLGILASVRGELEMSEGYLQRAERLCHSYRYAANLAPYSPRDLFLRPMALRGGKDFGGSDQCEANWKLLEGALTHTYYYLAQVHSSLGKTASAAAYCHTTLRRQLESGEFEPVEWAVHAATLSQHFVMNNDFPTARHHLACAQHILDEYGTKLASPGFCQKETTAAEEKEEGGCTSAEELEENLRCRRADVARCWAKYGLLLLSVSWDEKMRRSVGDVTEGLAGARIGGGELDTSSCAAESMEKDGSNEEDVAYDPDAKRKKTSMLFDLAEVTVAESQINCELVDDFDHARPVFLQAQKWLNRAMEYYSMENHAYDHVEIVQDASKLYKILCHFEPCADRRCKMHKRRVDLLEGALGQINPTFYLNACRQIQFELAETYSEMMDLKCTLYQQVSLMNPAAAKKVNHLAEQSIKYFQVFIDTFLDAQGKAPEEFPEELVRPALMAHFCIGRLHSKLVTPDELQQIANLKCSLERYTFVCRYCECHPSAMEVFREEYDVSREMAHLLPVKMDRLIQLQTVRSASASPRVATSN